MKLLNFTSLRTGFLALALVLTAGTINAQPNTSNRTPSTTEREFETTRTTHDHHNDNDNWGWIGLLGLLGLCGLLPKKRTYDNDRDRNDLNNKTTLNR